MSWRPRQTIPWLLATATLMPLATLGWLGVRTVQQDRELERQRRRERLELAAGKVALHIDRRLGAMEEKLAQGGGIRLTAAGLEAGEGVGLLYGPELHSEDATAAFAEAEALEFVKGDLTAAAAAYGRLADSPNRAVQGGALLRLGRVLRRQGDRGGALRAYRRLEAIGDVHISGQPSLLLAKQGRCRILEESNDAEGLRKEGAEIGRLLSTGSLRMDRATFDLYREMAEQWGAPVQAEDGLARTEAALQLWRTWRAGELPGRGRRVVEGERPLLAVWAGGMERPSAWIGSAAEMEAMFGEEWKAMHLAVSLEDIAGRPFLGAPREGAVVLSAGETRLPFTVRVGWQRDADGSDAYGRRDALLITGLAIAFALMLATGYGLYRTTMRELALARLQTDFVSSVSHEFRTPLTSMRHLMDLLLSRGVPSEERRKQYYELLSGETERLNRMVESLLSFGRMEGGAYAWQLEALDVGELARSVVEEFRREPEAKGREVMVDEEGQAPLVDADREALSRALWNLLENAAKYSEADTPIRVRVRTEGRSVLLAVEDRGVGIPVAEREKVFQKFVRGAEAKRMGVRGVGIGLALVGRIVEAHGGRVQLESEPGKGSTFTVVLPCHES